MEEQNRRVFLWALVEDPKALLAVDELVSIEPCPTVISVGRGDLSAALGHPGNINHPDVIAATERAIASVTSASSGRCVSAVMVHSVQEIAFWSERGARMFTYSADAPLLFELARGLVAGFESAIPNS
jgi:4-hydroxy-2-oxoheptanedioate aldolase